MDSQRIHRILRQHLRTEQLLGVESVPVAVDAPALARPEAAAEANEPAKALAGEPSRVAVRATPTPSETVAAAPPRSPLFSGKPLPKLERPARVEMLQAMALDAGDCTRCGLCRNRQHAVFGEGDPEAQLMFIGEGPGQVEDETGRPFVGPAGDLLDRMIAAMGLQREQVYIANTVKCRPPNNRAPLPNETAACWPYLQKQIETIQPRAIVTLGGPATKLMLQTDRGITAIRGTWGSCQPSGDAGPQVRVMPTFHPAYLLRSYTRENRQKVWSDLQRVMEYISGPV